MDDFEFEDIDSFASKSEIKIEKDEKENDEKNVEMNEELKKIIKESKDVKESKELSKTERKFLSIVSEKKVFEHSLGEVKTEIEEKTNARELCLVCGKFFKGNSKLKAHMLNTHTVHDPADCTCPICEKQLKSPAYLVTHNKQVHGGEREKFTCADCGHQFNKRSNLKMHIINVHTEYSAEELTCLICHKQMKNPSGLLSHIRHVHEDEKKLNIDVSKPCPYCGKIFKKHSNMKSHIKSVHTSYKDGECQCTICNKNMKNPESLKRHIKEVHEKEEDDNNTYFCNECGKTFKTKKYLRGHIYTAHTENRKMCEFCFNDYKNPAALRQHLRLVHGPVETVQCEICFKNYKNMTRLKHHYNDVHKIEESTCDQCGKVYKNKWLLGKHVRYMHKEEMKPKTESLELEETAAAPTYTFRWKSCWNMSIISTE